MPLFSDKHQDMDPKFENCTDTEEQGALVCKFGDGEKDRQGNYEKEARVVLTKDENGKPKARDSTFEGEWTDEQKEYLKNRAARQMTPSQRSALSGHTE